MRLGLVLLWALVAAVVLFVAGVFGTLVLSGRIQIGDNASTSASPQPSASESTRAEVDTTYQVLVLNATPDATRAAAVQQRVINAGYPAAQVAASSADSTDFKKTTVYFTKDEDETAAKALASALGVKEVVKDAAYHQGEGDAKQLTVVIGLDYTE